MTPFIRRGILARLADLARLVVWVGIIGFVAMMILGNRSTEQARHDAFARLEAERGSRVIAMIHRQERVALFGLPIGGYISIDDSEAVLRAIRLTPPEQPIDLVLHTPGGLVLASEQIARALAERPGRVTVLIPHYAMSGGTLIALAADDVIMDRYAVLGPVDPQIGAMPAASIISAVEAKPIARVSDQALILADIARKAQVQVRTLVEELLERRGVASADRAATARTLSDGRFTHDYPIDVPFARSLGLNVSTELPKIVYEIMALYPQSGSRRPSVIYLEPREAPRPNLPIGDERAAQR